MKRVDEVPVRIKKEPENQYDSKAIIFQCKLEVCAPRLKCVCLKWSVKINSYLVVPRMVVPRVI